MTVLATRKLTLSQGGRLLCRQLDVSFAPGEAWLVLGENGSGKSTLLSTLSGWRPPDQGEVLLDDQALETWPARERARRLAWMGQQDETPFPLSVLEKVLSGSHARRRRWEWESAADHEQARHWLAQLDLDGFGRRDLAGLSGGESRRVSLATALMQNAPVMLLDEPLSQLDLRHQQQALAIFDSERRRGRTLITVSHDPNHAGCFASHVLLLFGDGRWLAGPRDAILTADNLTGLYRYPVRECQVGERRWFLPETTASWN